MSLDITDMGIFLYPRHWVNQSTQADQVWSPEGLDQSNTVEGMVAKVRGGCNEI